MNPCPFIKSFLQHLRADIYPEPSGEPHPTITKQMIKQLAETGIILPGQRILDAGCGHGLALEEFARHGVDALGITLGPEAEQCRQRGLDVRDMDVSFLEFDTAFFDLIWCRHTLEHSFSPLLTLYGFYRTLKNDGRLYVEVPAPDTACHHEKNPNHYSVLGKSMWSSLFAKSGFILEWTGDFSFETAAGSDLYWSFMLRKKQHPPT
ncbi:MAG: class I SAM-dependent methyltransferase [Magnetococcales bacterium]|nr:class I SAM-dependent methyltransferase [Magnetococcales bacterium]